MTNKQLGHTQDYYTPDCDTVHDDVNCGVCGAVMSVVRGHHGPRGYVQNMTGSKSFFDIFSCQNRKTDWHIQIVALRKLADKTPSAYITRILLDEANDVLSTQKPTKQISHFWLNLNV